MGLWVGVFWWSSYECKKAFGVNIYELYGDMFLFEFPDNFMAEKTLQGQWKWRNLSFYLEWWSPVVGCMPNSMEVNKNWIKIIGIPLHLWSQQVFEEIEQLYGGWVATEEETKLKNHMKWARIFVTNSGDIYTKFQFRMAKSDSVFRYRLKAKQDMKCCRKKLYLAGEEDNNLKSGMLWTSR